MARAIKTQQKMEMLKTLWDGDLSMKAIGLQLGCSEASVYLWAKELGLQPRRQRMGQLVRAACARRMESNLDELRRASPPLSPQADQYMVSEARKREITLAELERRILRIVAKDHMVCAVLDDVN